MIYTNTVSSETPYLPLPTPCATWDGATYYAYIDIDKLDSDTGWNLDHIKTSGPLDMFGNKECSHYKYEGTVTLLDESTMKKKEVNPVNNEAYPPFPGYRLYGETSQTRLTTRNASGNTGTSYFPCIFVGASGYVDLSYSTSRGATIVAGLSISRSGSKIRLEYKASGTGNRPGDFWHNNPKPKDPLNVWPTGATWYFTNTYEYEVLNRSGSTFSLRWNYSNRERYWYSQGLKLVKYDVETPWQSRNVGASVVYMTATPDSALSTIVEAIHLTDGLLDTTEYSKTTADGSKDSLWSLLTVRALESQKIIDCNLVMSIIELKNLATDLTATLESYQQVGRGVKELLEKGLSKKKAKQLSKDVASAHLSSIYGYNLTLSECMQHGTSIADLLDDVRETLSYRQTLKAADTYYDLWGCEGYNPLSMECHYSVTLRPESNGFSEVYDYLNRFSAWVSLTDAWDFIPYSFVVDWLFPVGKLLEAADTMAWQANHEVMTIVKSKKTKATIEPHRAFPGLLSKNILDVGTLRVTKYHRWVESSFDSPPLYPDLGSIPDILRTHWPEGTSLIVQRL